MIIFTLVIVWSSNLLSTVFSQKNVPTTVFTVVVIQHQKGNTAVWSVTKNHYGFQWFLFSWLVFWVFWCGIFFPPVCWFLYLFSWFILPGEMSSGWFLMLPWLKMGTCTTNGNSVVENQHLHTYPIISLAWMLLLGFYS